MTRKLFSPKASKSPAKSQRNIAQDRAVKQNRQNVQLKMFQVTGRGGKGHGVVSANHAWNRKGRW